MGETAMFAPTHNILNTQSSGMSARRMSVISGVALLHVLIVYALVSGMAQKIMKFVPPVMTVDTQPEAQPKPAPPPPTPVLQRPTLQPTQVDVPVPVIQTVPEEPTIDANPTPQVPPPATPDAGAAGLTNTHTVPPYPALARTQGHQGTVLLQLVVSAQGNVTSAAVVQSSGFPELDQAAVEWVQAHWRYNPAMQGGVPVPSQTSAAVRFDLRQATR
jgi:periplasmic protein TonB